MLISLMLTTSIWVYKSNLFLLAKSLNQYQWIEMHSKNHLKFEHEFGGKVFFVYSTKSSGKEKNIQYRSNR